MTPERLEDMRKRASGTGMHKWIFEPEEVLELLAYVDELKDIQLLNFMEVRKHLEAERDQLKEMLKVENEKLRNLYEDTITEIKRKNSKYAHSLEEENQRLKAENEKLISAHAESVRLLTGVSDKNQRLKERIGKLEKIKGCSKSLANTWWEFGPECGAFGEYVDHLEKALAADEEGGKGYKF